MELIIFTGNIGCGKSLLASKYAKRGYVVVNMDAITTMVQGGEYGLYDSKKKLIYHTTEAMCIETALTNGFSVVIDRTNMKKSDRKRYIDLGKRHGARIKSICWGAGDCFSTFRRIKNPRGIPMSQWDDVAKHMTVSYEPPEITEGFNIIHKGPTRYYFYAIDFDGTIVTNEYPLIGEPIPAMIENMREWWRQDTNIIIIWTCRSGDNVAQVKKFLIKNDIPFDFINENPLFDTGGRKIFANEYHDDRNAKEES